jgi:hypothetical protein
MATKYINNVYVMALQNIFGDFWFGNIPSGNPVRQSENTDMMSAVSAKLPYVSALYQCDPRWGQSLAFLGK